jgi:hypothetical protein
MVTAIPDEYAASIFRTGVKMNATCYLRMLVKSSFNMFRVLKLKVCKPLSVKHSILLTYLCEH